MAAFAASVPSAAAQAAPGTPQYQDRTRPEQEERRPLANRTRIRLVLRDSTLRFVLLELGALAGRPITFNSMLPQLRRRIDVDIDKVDPLEAVLAALRNTGLSAFIANDGETIVVRGRDVADTTDAKGTGRISGTVTDSVSRQALMGATVQVEGTETRVRTRKDGTFIIPNVVAGDRFIAIRVLGYRAQRIKVVVREGERALVNVIMIQSATALNDVVTTATGSQRKVEVAHDIARINADEVMKRAPVRSVSDLIEAAQVPGVLLQRQSGDPGAPTRIRIRGIGSISQSNDPVVIVDGAWIDAAGGTPSRLDDIDPSTIESVEIVRGPSAATLYGQNAANGVIVITTKKGKAGASRWDFGYSRDWGQTYGSIPLAYVGYGHSPTNSQVIPCPVANVLAFFCVQDSVAIFNPNSALLAREGVATNNRFLAQLSGGSDAVTYAITATDNTTTGVRRTAPVELIRFRELGYNTRSAFTRPSALDRQNITTNLSLSPRRNMTLGITLSGTQTNLKDNQYTANYTALQGLDVARSYSIDTIGVLAGNSDITAGERPVRSSSGLLAGTLQWKPIGNWIVNANVGAERTLEESSVYEARTLCRPGQECADTFGVRTETSDNKALYSVRLNASTTLNLGPLGRFLEIRPAVGVDYTNTEETNLFLSKDQIPAGERSISAGRLAGSAYSRIATATAGWYLNSTIGLFHRLYFDAGIRRDAGSAITSSHPTYPKLGVSWLLSDEPFWRRNSLISLLRLRAAVGSAAVQPDITDVNGRYLSGFGYVDGKFVRTVDPTGAGNSSLRPERGTELEVGFDADVLADRLNLIVTYARADNKNTLITRTIPPSSGIPSGARKENLAGIRNRNLELSANARVIDRNNARVDASYGLTLSDNMVTKLGNGLTPFDTRNVSRIQPGYPLASVWMRPVIGYRDGDGNGLISANEVVLGDSIAYVGWSQPRVRASYGLSVTLHNHITFDTRFASQSGYVQEYTRDNRYGAEDIHAPQLEQAFGAITQYVGHLPENRLTSDLRWSSASITVQMPQRLLRMMRTRSLSVSLQGNNLALWTNYIGRDPGVNSALLSSESTSDNGATTPRPRLFVLDFKFGL